jgi:hypothetical protein
MKVKYELWIEIIKVTVDADGEKEYEYTNVPDTIQVAESKTLEDAVLLRKKILQRNA